MKIMKKNHMGWEGLWDFAGNLALSAEQKILSSMVECFMKREAWRLNVRERIWKSQINMKTFKMATETYRKKGKGRDGGEEFFLGWEKSIAFN